MPAQRTLKGLAGDNGHIERADGMSEVERAIPILPGLDLRAAKEFYVARLGFQVRLGCANLRCDRSVRQIFVMGPVTA